MRAFIVMLLLFPSVVRPSTLSHFEPVLINGDETAEGEFKEVIEVVGEDHRGQWTCTATIIGARVVLTAGHCLGGPKDILETRDGNELHCEQHPAYARGNQDADMALCVAVKKFEAPYAIVGKEPVEVGEKVLLTGYGCTSRRKEGAGILRIGHSSIVETADLFFVTQGDVALCFGDSGGPVFADHSEDLEKHVVVGVNSRGDISTVSILTALTSKPALEFFRAFEKKRKVRVCGVGRSC